MHFSHLSLADFRSYAAVDVALEPGVTVFVGPNGQGKTNLVEALGYVTTLGSHRVATDAALVRAGAARAVLRTRIVRGDRASTVEIEICPGKSNRARINGSPAARPRDVLGIARTVLFAPEDLALVKGEPDGRRRFLDQLAVLLIPRVAALHADYDRVLRQRGALLRSAGGSRPARRVAGGVRRPADSEATIPGTLDLWDERLASLGAQITALRLQLAAALGPYAASAYEELSGGQSEAVIDYRSSAGEALGHGPRADVPGTEELHAQLTEAMAQVRAKELDRGISLVGPHRDDMVLTLGGLPAKGYASHGESWSLALALRLASYRLLTHGHEALPWASHWGVDGEPILVLDDVFAELDVRRRDRLAALVAPAGQVIVTAAVPGDIPGELAGARFAVQGGTVHRA